MDPRTPVTFVPAGVTVWVEPGTLVLDAARKAGVIIAAPCGGRGVCGTCGVRVLEGHLADPDDVEATTLKRAPQSVRLACRARIAGPVTIRPVVAGRVETSSAGDEGGDETFFAGIDVGTTSVGAVIVGETTGRELGRAVVPNQQQSFGMDVVSRVSAAIGGQAEELRVAAANSVLAALEAACGRAGACVERVNRVAIAANTAMLALLEGVDVSSLAQAPFSVPAGLSAAPTIPGLADRLADAATVIAVPWMGGFVGGDAAAGLLSAGLLSDSTDSIYVDVGTNAEIVVRSKGRMYYSSAAAGPAFEGYSIASGGPAADGAIIGVHVAEDVELIVMGNEPGKWFAGSGLISAMAELLRTGHLDAEGLLRKEGPLVSRFSTDDAGVVRVGFGPHGEAPFLTQLDVRALQTAKAAVAAGIYALASTARLKARRVERMVVSGTFGAALPAGQLVALGIVPEELEERVESLPDGVLDGTAAIAFDPSVVSELEREIADAERVELATLRTFTDDFVKATQLAPYTLKRGF